MLIFPLWKVWTAWCRLLGTLPKKCLDINFQIILLKILNCQVLLHKKSFFKVQYLPSFLHFTSYVFHWIYMMSESMYILNLGQHGSKHFISTLYSSSSQIFTASVFFKFSTFVSNKILWLTHKIKVLLYSFLFSKYIKNSQLFEHHIPDIFLALSIDYSSP